MGCCMSSSQNSHNPLPNSDHFHSSDITHLTKLEEETVIKEVVISETPKIIKPSLPNSPPMVESPIPSSPESSVSSKRSKLGEEISETELSLSGVSDFLSFSAIDGVLSSSTATTRREKDEKDEEEVVGPTPVYVRRKKSFSGEFSGAGGRVGGVRPPEKRSSLFAPARGNVGYSRNRGVPAGVGCRLLCSPETRGVGDRKRCMVEKGVATKTGAPGSRFNDGNIMKSRRVVEEPNDAVSSALVESLENPLVSLECFIFL